MKKINITIVVVLMSANFAMAQDAISKFFTKYQRDESFSQVTISSKMFSLLQIWTLKLKKTKKYWMQ